VRDPIRPVQDAVRAALAEAGPGLVGVACSGGADSIALADAAIEVAGAARIAVLTIDHGISPGSAQISEAVAAWARGRGAAALVERVAVPRRASIEAAAREARYTALERLAERITAARVFVGHTARDQAETVLLRLLRGTGPAGLAGIPPARGRFVRPLLSFDREAIERYVAARALPIWDDPMNDELRLARVRVRRELLPRLRLENPQLDAALVRLSRSAAEWLEVIDGLAAPHARLPIACAALAALPAAVRKRAVALALERAGLGYEAAHLEAIDRAVTRPAHGTIRIDLPAARLARIYDQLEIEPTPEPGAGAGSSQLPREEAAPALARTPSASHVPGAPVGPALVPAPLVPPPGPYLLRTWQRGDRMKPARLKGRSRKLSDLYVDAKIPQAVRASARVLVRTTTGAIVWAEHLGLAYEEPPGLEPARSGGVSLR
jgi:tRNA(Ile)-lysidine synthase